MYRSILVPLDGTSFGEAAIPHAVAIAQQARAPLYLAHVHLPPMVPSGAEAAALPLIWVETARKEKRHYLDTLAHDIAAREQVEVFTRVVDGGITAALAAQVRECSADLIVMSTHGHVGLRRLWHHGVAEQLAQDLPIPALFVRTEIDSVQPYPQPGWAWEIRNILVLLEDSLRSERILEHAATLASVCGARLTLAGVLGEGGRPGEGDPPGQEGATLDKAEAELRPYLERAAERLTARRLNVTTRVLRGERAGDMVAEHIESRAADPRRRIDLVAMESVDRHLVSRLLFRDLGDELLERCPVPILRCHAAVSAQPPPLAEPEITAG